MTKRCPICDLDQSVRSVQRDWLPVLQNRVFATRDEALQSPIAPFVLQTCVGCGFSFDGAFDGALVVYDQQYDNDVPSDVFRRYYEALAQDLVDRFALTEGVVYDVGCGRGTFLRTLCRVAPGIRGVGIDPSCQPVQEGNFTLVQDVFRPGLFGETADWFSCGTCWNTSSSPSASCGRCGCGTNGPTVCGGATRGLDLRARCVLGFLLRALQLLQPVRTCWCPLGRRLRGSRSPVALRWSISGGDRMACRRRPAATSD